MKKKYSILTIALMLASSASIVFADASSGQLTTWEKVPVDTIENGSFTTIDSIVKLSALVSHRNYHTTYGITVIRQGKKHVITYEPAPKSIFKYCKGVEYVNQY